MRANPLSELARYGFEELSQALQNLDKLVALVGDRGHVALAYLQHSASPDKSLEFLNRMAEASPKAITKLLGKEDAAIRVLRLVGASDAMADLLARKPELLELFYEPTGIPKRFDVATSDRSALRISYRKLLTQIADWDLGQEPQVSYQPVSRALSDLTDAALSAGLEVAKQELLTEGRITKEQLEECALAVIAMGKAGAQELNYLSDVDVIYASNSQGDSIATATKIAARLALVMDEAGIEPGLWQVDPNLRPEGKDGVLVRTVDSHLTYYEKWAHPWEFQALLKARFVAGDQSVGEDYISRIKPMIWKRENRAEIVESARNLRRRVLEHIPQAEQEREIKLGRGGLRDVEFTAQLLQLVHGVADDSLRVMNTISALEALGAAGLLGRSDMATFINSYKTLRTIEHRVQLLKLRRTHLMPSSESELRRVARSISLSMGATDLEKLWGDLRFKVAELHDTVFYRPLLSAAASLTPGEVALSEEDIANRLTALGFSDPKGAMNHIKALTSGVSRRATIQRTLLPVLIRYMAEGTNPDRALITFRRLSERLGDTPWFLRMLRDSSGAAERLMRTLSLSAFASRLLEHIPESSAWFGSKEELSPVSEELLQSEMDAVIDRGSDSIDVAESLRQVRRREVLRCAIAAIVGDAQLPEISKTLTVVTECYLRSMLKLSQQGEGEELDLGIVAMGRLGGAELGFGSDADVMLVYLGDGAEIQAKAEKITAKLIAVSKDPLLHFELDLDLRPEGKNGPRIKSLDAYRGYYEKWADTWEFQALIRARLISGSEQLASQFKELIDPYRYPQELSQKQLVEIRRIKARVETERLPQGADPARHLKLGRGSISDVEWLVQLYQLRYAHQYPQLRDGGTLATLAAMAEANLISQEQSQKLVSAWLISSRIRSALVLGIDKGGDILPVDSTHLESVARILEYSPGSASDLEQDYLSITRKSRTVFEELFLK